MRSGLLWANKASGEESNQPSSQPGSPQEVICPVCQAELRVHQESGKVGGKIPIAELIRRGPDKEKVESKKDEPTHPDFAHMSVEERERQIARAREAHPVQLYPAMKPRLDYVLSGEAPQPGKEATRPKVTGKPESESDKSSQKSLNE